MRHITLVLLGVAILNLVVASAQAGSLPWTPPPRIDQAAQLQSTWGPIGVVRPAPAICEYDLVGRPQIRMAPPHSMEPSFDTVGREAQTVWWKPRVWWPTAGGGFAVTDWNTWEWHSTLARSGNNPGGMWPVLLCHEGQPCIQGAAGAGTVLHSSLFDWTSESGVTRDYSWTQIATLDLTVSRRFAVENIYYWQRSPSQPDDGMSGGLVPMLVGDLNLPSGNACDF